jgi:hypothetical protein
MWKFFVPDQQAYESLIAMFFLLPELDWLECDQHLEIFNFSALQ